MHPVKEMKKKTKKKSQTFKQTKIHFLLIDNVTNQPCKPPIETILV